MTDTQTDTQTDAERLAKLTAENESMRGDLAELGAMKEHAKNQETALATATEANTELRTQLADVGLGEALRKAAAVLDIPASTVEDFYKHEFSSEVGADGKLVISPNPVEHLAKKIKAGDVLLKPAQAREQTRQADATALANPKATAEAVLAALDRDPQKKVDYILKHGDDAYLNLSLGKRLPGN